MADLDEAPRQDVQTYCQDETLIVAIDTIEPISGSLPRKQQRLVEAWAELHRDELLEDWNHLQEGRPPAKIEPLR